MAKNSKNKKLFGGLTGVCASVLAVAIAGTALCYEWAILVDDVLGVSSGGSISGEATEESVYYKSSYGDITGLYISKDKRTAAQQTELDKLQKKLLDAEKAFATREAEEGNVLLYNREMQDGKALPLQEGSKVTLFGYASAHPVYRSSSGGASPNVEGRTISLAQSLKNSGIVINEALQTALEATADNRRIMSPSNGKSDIGELEVSFYDSYKSSFSSYSDAAIVTFARTGGEGNDLNTTDIDGVKQLSLHQDEIELLKMIKASGAFKKVIVLINSGYPMELGWVDDEEYGVDACLWIGDPGMYGFQGVANIVSGKANPSGKLVDTYAENSLSSPAMSNFGDISYTNNSEYKYVVEAENIYVGYKYYETRYEDAILGRGNASAAVGSSDGKAWNYAKEVTYPFGYGLSYTQFEQSIKSVVYDEETDAFTVSVSVKNVGGVAGKCAVQVYAQTPYNEQVESEAIRLVGFNKTLGTTSSGEKETNELSSLEMGVLAPGEEEIVEVTVDKYLLTSYSELARGGKGGYVLTGGDYYLAVGENAHEALNNVLRAKGATGMVDENNNAYVGDESRVEKLGTWAYDEDSYSASPYTGETVENQMSLQNVDNWADGVTYLSRSNWEATYPSLIKLTLTDAMKNEMDGGTHQQDGENPSKGTYTQGVDKGIDFIDMKDVPFSGAFIDANGVEKDADKLWEDFLSQLTTEELVRNTTNGKGAVDSINSPNAGNGDGPDGSAGSMDNGEKLTCYNSEVVAASTFNPKMLSLRGDFLAEDCLISKRTILWGPGANIHRTPYSGRNFEYYSECGYMSYLCSYYQVRAMQNKGLITCIKHFAGNNQETNRTGVATFNTEQAWRESSFKAFEGAIAKGGSKGVMTSFSLIGCTPAPSCRASNIDIMQNEWGFNGVNITDSSYQMSYMDSVDCLVNGTTLFCLDNRENDLNKRIARSGDDSILAALRRANKQYYYTLLRSNATNGITEGASISSSTSWWKTALIAVDSALALLTLACAGTYVFLSVKKKEEKND